MKGCYCGINGYKRTDTPHEDLRGYRFFAHIYPPLPLKKNKSLLSQRGKGRFKKGIVCFLASHLL